MKTTVEGLLGHDFYLTAKKQEEKTNENDNQKTYTGSHSYFPHPSTCTNSDYMLLQAPQAELDAALALLNKVNLKATFHYQGVNSAIKTIFPIWPIVKLPNLCFPNT